MADERFANLNVKISELIELSAQMKRENQLLRDNEHQWQSERQKLLDKQEVAKSRLQALAGRLNSLKQA